MTGTTTGQVPLLTGTDSDDAEHFLTVSLTADLQTVDNLFNNTTGHDHSGAGKGAPVSGAGIASGVTLTSPTITSPTITGGAFGAWTSWAPALTGVSSTTNSSSRWRQVGKDVDVTGNVVAGGGGAPGRVLVSTLPVAPFYAGSGTVVGTFAYTRVATPIYAGVVVLTSATTIAFLVADNAGELDYLGTAPAFTIASGDSLSFKLAYESV